MGKHDIWDPSAIRAVHVFSTSDQNPGFVISMFKNSSNGYHHLRVLVASYSQLIMPGGEATV